MERQVANTCVRAAAGGGVLDDEVRRRAFGAELALVEAVAGLLEGVGEVERLGELGVKEAPGTEARLHHQQPRRALGVAGEHEEAAQGALVIHVCGRRGGGRPLAAAGGEGPEVRRGRGGVVGSWVGAGARTEAGAEAGDGGAEHRGLVGNRGGGGVGFASSGKNDSFGSGPGSTMACGPWAVIGRRGGHQQSGSGGEKSGYSDVQFFLKHNQFF